MTAHPNKCRTTCTAFRTLRRVAESTGGKAIRRASDIGNSLDSILRDTQATYLASFTPDSAPDGTFHKITLKVISRQGITLRYRSGYFFDKESTDPKAKFSRRYGSPSIPPISDSPRRSSRITRPKFSLMIALKDVTMDTQGIAGPAKSMSTSSSARSMADEQILLAKR